MAARPASRRPLAIVTASLADAANIGLRRVKRSPATQADLLHIFVGQSLPANASSSRSYHALSSRTRPAVAHAATAHLPRALIGARRCQHVEPRRDPPTSSPAEPLSSKLGSSRAGKDSTKAATRSPSQVDYQTAGPPPSSPGPIGVAPGGSASSGAELGSSANQTAASQVILAEKQQKELEAKEAEEQRRKRQPMLRRAWEKVKEEALHYWHGSKLLAKEVKISSRLLRRLMLGYNLTRREHRQLKRTFGDLLRLIPFVPFIIVPAGELLLPVAVKIFPNMLPSTFESKFAVEEKRRRLIKVRLEMAKFLQETIREDGIRATETLQSSEEFKEFFRKVRSTGDKPTDQDIIKVAKLLDDDVTLDNLTRPQLVSMCRYMQINAFGTDNFLRFQIRSKLQSIRRDDMTISAEGIDHMSGPELQSACQSRGIQTSNLGEARLREEMAQWIELHLHQRISGTLLILSKAFNYLPHGADPSPDSAKSQLKSLELTLSSLPDNLLSEAELNVSKESATNKQRLEVLEQQEELIEDEAEQEQAEEEARREEKERKRLEAQRKRRQDAREEREARAMLPPGEVDQEAQDVRMTNEQLTELGEALSILSAKSSVLREREELAQLIKEMSEAGSDAAAASDKVAEGGSSSSASTPEAASKPATAEGSASADAGAEAKSSSSSSSGGGSSHRGLTKRIKSMLQKIDRQLEAYDRDVGSRMNIIEASPTGKISVDDLEQALRLIKHSPPEDVLEKLVDKLDVDNDGLVPMADIVELARRESGLGIVRDDEVKDISRQGAALREEKKKPRREDILEE